MPVSAEFSLLAERVHLLLGLVPLCESSTPATALPPNGIYAFLERGETVRIRGALHDRIVRVGTYHTAGRFPLRVRSHKSVSVFRLHLGAHSTAGTTA